MWTLFFAGTASDELRNREEGRHEAFARFFWEMMDRGFYLPCSQFEAAFLSTPMTVTDVDRTIEAARESLVAVAKT